MINSVTSSTLLNDGREDRPSKRSSPETRAEPADGKALSKAQPDVRLLIEQDDRRGGLVYKRVDRSTGRILSATSREDMLKISADPSYAVGAVISTKA